MVLLRLMRWYRANGRHALPWRHTRDPYAVFVSETMLQQTQVDRVLPFYTRWLRRFPAWNSLARAKTDALIRAWAGLGYNRRALYAREAARIVVKNGTPRTVEEWRALPGVGAYASSAIFSFTRQTFVPAIDTNVRRVIGRLFLGIPFPTADDDARIRLALTKNAPRTHAHRLTYALMDFGSAVCTSKNPHCLACPLQSACPSKRYFGGNAKPFNRPAPRKKERRYGSKPFPDRIYRGRILSLVRIEGRADIRAIGSRIDTSFNRANDEAWMNALIARLIREGFLERKKFALTLSRA